MSVARFGPFKVTGSDGRPVQPGTPITVMSSNSGEVGAVVHIFSDDGGLTEITGQKEAFQADATGATSGTESVTSSIGIVLTDEDSNISFVVERGDYFLVIPSDENPLPIEVGNTAGFAFSETVIVKAGVVSVANNVAPPGTAMPVEGSAFFKARIGTAPLTTPVVLRINKNAVAVGSIKIAASATSQNGVDPSTTVCTAAVAGTDTLAFTVGTGHGVVVGEVIETSGFTPSAYNGTWKVSAIGSTSITVTDTGAVSGTPANASVVGGIRRGIPVPLQVAAGDILTYDVTVIGTSTVGSDLALDISVQ